MSAPQPVPLVDSVLFPTDFSAASERAFAHALALALLGQTRLTLLHVGRSSRADWTRFPAVRKTLEQWGLLEPGSPRSAVFDELKVRVKKAVAPGRFPARAVLGYLDDEPCDLIVLATEGKDGLARWLKGSVAESVARSSRTMTLFVPVHAERGFVGLADGEVRLRSLLLPVDHHPSPGKAIDVAQRMVAAIGSDARITLLHIGDEPGGFPIGRGAADAAAFERISRAGDPVEQILEVAELVNADLLVMPTAGHHGIFDALRGSTTEQVLRHAPCPLLAVPSYR